MRNSQQYLAALKRAKNNDDEKAAQTLTKLLEYSLQNEGYSEPQAIDFTLNFLSNYEKPGFFENLGSGIGSGFVGALETGALGANALQEEQAELETRSKIQDFAGGMKPKGGNQDSWTYKIGTGLGSIGAFLPAAGLGILSAPLAAGTAAGLGIAMGAGEASERARAFGTDEETRNDAIRKGALVGSTEAVPIFKVIKSIRRLTGKLPDEVIAQTEGRLMSMAKTGAYEGIQETVAAIGQNLIEQGYNPEKVLLDAAVAEEGTIGGISGAIFQGALDLLGGRRVRNTPDATQQEGDLPPLTDADIAGAQGELSGFDPSDGPTPPPIFDPAALERAGVAPPITLDTDMFDQLQQENQAEQQRLQQEGLDPESIAAWEREMGISLADLSEAERLEVITDPKMQFPNFRRGPKEQPSAAPAPETAETQEQEWERETGLSIADLNAPAPESDAAWDQAMGEYESQQSPQGIASLAGNREKATRDNELFNTALGRTEPGGQPDMFEVERIQGQGQQSLPAMQQRQAAEQQAQTEEQILAKEDAELAEIFAQEERAKQMEMDLDPVAEPVAEPEQTGTPGVNRRNQQRRVRKQLARDQERRQKQKDQIAKARAERKAQAEQQQVVPEQPPVELTAPRSPDQVGVNPVASAVQQGVQDMQRAPAAPVPAAQQQTTPVAQETTAAKPAQEPSATSTPEASAATNESADINKAELRKLTVPQLKEKAQAMGIKRASTMSKPNLVNAIATKARKAPTPATPPVNETTETAAPKTTTPEEVKKETTPAAAPASKPEEVKKETTPAAAPASKPATKTAETKVETKPASKPATKTAKPSEKTTTALETTTPEQVTEKTTPAAAPVAKTSTPASKPAEKTETKSQPAWFKKLQKTVEKLKENSPLRMYVEAYGDADTIIEAMAFDFVNAPKNKKAAEKGKINITRNDLKGLDPETAKAIKAIGDTSFQDTANAAMLEAETLKITELTDGVRANLKKNETLKEKLTNNTKKRDAKEKRDEKQSTGVIAQRDSTVMDGNLASSEVLILENTSPEFEAVQSTARYEAVKQELMDMSEGIFDDSSYNDVDRDAQVALDEQAKADNLKKDADTIIRQDKKEETTKQKISRLEHEKKLRDLAKELDDLNRKHPSIGLLGKMHPAVRIALRQGNLKAAFKALAITSQNPALKQMAELMQLLADGVTVKLVSGLKHKGETISGRYDIETNTIELNSDVSLESPLVLMHEMAHAITATTLADKKNKAANQLRDLFKAMKSDLENDPAIREGFANVYEFVAEALVNPEFQAKLAVSRVPKTRENWLQRVIRAIQNMFNKLFKTQFSTENALEQSNRLIEMVIAPPRKNATLGPSRYFLMSSSPLGATQAWNDFTRQASEINTGPHSRYGLNSGAAKASFKDFIKSFGTLMNSGVANDVKNAVMSFFPLHDVASVAKHYNFGDLGYAIAEAVERNRGRQDQNERVLTDKVVEINKLLSEIGADKTRDLNQLVYSREFGATIHQVDPTKPADYYKGDKKVVYDKQRELWTRIGPQGQLAFKKARKIYADQQKALLDVIKQQAEAVSDDQIGGANRKKEILARINEMGNLQVYFPLIREGRFRLEYTMKDDRVGSQKDVRIVEMFKSRAEAERAKGELETNDDVDVIQNITDKKYGASDMDNIRGAGGLIGDVLTIMEANGVNGDVQAEIVNLFIDSLPETSIAKAFKKRQGVAGYIPDLQHGLGTRAFELSRQTEIFRSSKELSALNSKIIAKEKELAAVPSNKSVLLPLEVVRNEMQERISFALKGAKHKGFDRVARGLNQTAFVFTIGFNVASSIVNLSQLPMYVLPVVGADYGYRNTTDALLKAGKIVFGTSRASDSTGAISKNLEKGSIAHGLDALYNIDDNGDFSPKEGLPIPKAKLEEMLPLVKQAYERGQLNRSMLDDFRGANEQARVSKNPIKRAVDMFTNLSAGMFNQAERFNRQTTMLAIYNLEIAKQKKDLGVDTLTKEQLDAAANHAIHETRQANGGNMLEQAPRIAQEGIGRVAMMYKTYGVQMYLNMFTMAKRTLDSDKQLTKEQRTAAFRKLVGLHMSSAFFAGIYGMPIYGAIKVAADAFLDDDEDDFDAIAQDFFSEGMFRGGVNAIMEAAGVDIDAGSRMRLTELLFQANRYNPDASAEESIFFYLGGPAWSTIKRFGRAFEDLTSPDGDTQRGLEGILPPALANFSKVNRYATDNGILTRRLDPIVEDLSSGELAAQIIGFAPDKYLRRQEEASRLKGISTAVQEKRSKIIEGIWLAERSGDYGRLEELYDHMEKFNDRHEAFVIDAKALKTSFKRRDQQSERMYHGVSLSPDMAKTIGDFEGMYDTPYSSIELYDD